MPRLIWVFAGRTFILLVLSCRGCNGFPSHCNVMPSCGKHISKYVMVNHYIPVFQLKWMVSHHKWACRITIRPQTDLGISDPLTSKKYNRIHAVQLPMRCLSWRRQGCQVMQPLSCLAMVSFMHCLWWAPKWYLSPVKYSLLWDRKSCIG